MGNAIAEHLILKERAVFRLKSCKEAELDSNMACVLASAHSCWPSGFGVYATPVELKAVYVLLNSELDWVIFHMPTLQTSGEMENM